MSLGTGSEYLQYTESECMQMEADSHQQSAYARELFEELEEAQRATLDKLRAAGVDTKTIDQLAAWLGIKE